MPNYKYKFCDGSESEIQINEEHNTLLKKMDRQEKNNERRHRGRQIPLDTLKMLNTDMEGNIIGNQNPVIEFNEDDNDDEHKGD